MSTLTPSSPPSPTPEDRIRRLLADARHTEPVPDDVADRLDRVLADLSAEQGDAPSPAVADLAAARRRRNRARTWLVAAAAVVAVGIGVDQLAQHDVVSSGGGSSTTSSDSMSAGSTDAGSAGAEAPRPRGAHRSEAAQKGLGAYDAAGAVPLSGDRFADRVARLRDRAVLDRNGLSAVAPDHGDVDSVSGRIGKCLTADIGRGHWVAVRYDGAPGVLVYRPVRGDTQVVDLFLCGGAEPTRSITLPAP